MDRELLETPRDELVEALRHATRSAEDLRAEADPRAAVNDGVWTPGDRIRYDAIHAYINRLLDDLQALG